MHENYRWHHPLIFKSKVVFITSQMYENHCWHHPLNLNLYSSIGKCEPNSCISFNSYSVAVLDSPVGGEWTVTTRISISSRGRAPILLYDLFQRSLTISSCHSVDKYIYWNIQLNPYCFIWLNRDKDKIFFSYHIQLEEERNKKEI